jgi:hypothetical protein
MGGAHLGRDWTHRGLPTRTDTCNNGTVHSPVWMADCWSENTENNLKLICRMVLPCSMGTGCSGQRLASMGYGTTA